MATTTNAQITLITPIPKRKTEIEQNHNEARDRDPTLNRVCSCLCNLRNLWMFVPYNYLKWAIA